MTANYYDSQFFRCLDTRAKKVGICFDIMPYFNAITLDPDRPTLSFLFWFCSEYRAFILLMVLAGTPNLESALQASNASFWNVTRDYYWAGYQ